MAKLKYLPQAVQMCTNALKMSDHLTPRQKRTFKRFLQDYNNQTAITDKQIRKVLRRSRQLQNSLTQKVGGPV